MNQVDNGRNSRISYALLDRRTLLKSSGGLALLLGIGGIASACTSSSSGSNGSATASAAGSATPRRGGTLRVGASGGGTSDTVDPHNLVLGTDIARVYMLYNQLAKTADSGETILVLADSITPNSDATEWTLKLKPGVLFHDGTPLTAADILWNFKRVLTNKFSGASALGPLDVTASKAIDAATVSLKFTEPYATLIDNLALYYFGIIPQTWNPKAPVGTGPFKFQSFTPGVESRFVRNEHYWVPGLPYLDAVVMTDVADETVRVSGMQAQQFDVTNYLSASSATALAGSGLQVVKSKSGGFVPFVLRTDIPPFNDVRVSQAFKLIIDRQQMLDAVFGGYGQIGNDIPSLFDPKYDKTIPQRTHDIGQAKSLLAAAGMAGMKLDLFTSTGAGSGAVQMAQVLATQAKAAGVTLTVKQQDPTTFFANSYKHVPMCMEYWQYLPYAAMAKQAFLPTSPWNSTFRNNPAYNALYATLAKTTDVAAQTDLVHQMMKIDYDSGGQIIPFFLPEIDAAGPKVRALHPSVTGISPGGADFEHMCIDA